MAGKQPAPEFQLAKAAHEYLCLVERVYQQTGHDCLHWHTPNEAKRSRWERRVQKAIGLLAGVPDIICCFGSREGFRMIFIELKVKPNKLTPAQMAVATRLRCMGAVFQICYSIDDIRRLLRKEIPHETLKELP